MIVSDLEITPYGLYSVEFDDEGTIDIWFVPIRPGSISSRPTATRSRGMVGKFVVK